MDVRDVPLQFVASGFMPDERGKSQHGSPASPSRRAVKRKECRDASHASLFSFNLTPTLSFKERGSIALPFRGGTGRGQLLLPQDVIILSEKRE